MDSKHRRSILATLLVVATAPMNLYGEEWDLGSIPEVEIECLAVSPEAGSRAPDPEEDGSWLQMRRDRRLTGRSPLVGHITCPEVVWSVDLGIRKSYVSIRPQPGASGGLEIPGSGDHGDLYGVEERFELSPWISLGDGESINLTDATHKFGDFLPELPGPERVSCDSAAFCTGCPQSGPLPCFLERWHEGEWHEVWRTELLPGFTNTTTTNGNPVVADLDGDGELEAAVEGWHDVYLLDMASGAVEQVTEFTPRNPGIALTGRAYGWFGAFDLGGDDRLELVMLAEMEPFVGVLGWRGGDLVELWDHHIELRGAKLNRTIHQPGPTPVDDIDGDGRPEIVTRIYNEDGDGRWHTVAFEGMTGDVMLDLVDSYLSGLDDLDGDGVAELFLTRTSGQMVPERGPARIVSFADGELRELWSREREGFELYDLTRLPLHVNTWANYHPRRTVFLREDWTGFSVFATRADAGDGAERIAFYRWLDGSVQKIAELSGPRLDLLGLPASAPERGILLRSFTDEDGSSAVHGSGVTTTLESSSRARRDDGPAASSGSLLRGSVVSAPDGAEPPLLLSERFDETLVAYQLGRGAEPRKLWQAQGRGMSNGEYSRSVANTNSLGSAIVADLFGDGPGSVVAAGRDGDGQAVMRAFDTRGEILWETPFALPGDPPTFRIPGITNWTAGRFRFPDLEDVLVTAGNTPTRFPLRLLDGRTGEILWERVEAGPNGQGDTDIGIVSAHFALFDWDGDGLDEIVSTQPGMFAVYDGGDGALLFNRPLDGPPASRIFPEVDTCCSEGLPVVADLLGDGSGQVLWGKSDMTMAVLGLDGRSVWHTPFWSGLLSTTLQGIGDLDGDGDLDLVVAGHCDDPPGDEIRVYEARNGELRWTLDLPSTCDWPEAKHVVTGDIDGDGRDEALIADANVLHAVGETPHSGQGRFLWRAHFNRQYWDELGETVIADVDGSGHPQILINTGHGYLYGLGAPCEVTSPAHCPPGGPWLESPALPGFRAKVRISAGGGSIAGTRVADCIGETLCVAGAVADRAEIFLRVVGPKPNGKLWPTLVKFSTSRIEVWIEQSETGELRYYDLAPVAPGQSLLTLEGLADKEGFEPPAVGSSVRIAGSLSPLAAPLAAAATGPPAPGGPWLEASGIPGFRAKVRISAGGGSIDGTRVADCIGETLCVAGAVPGRAEIFLRVVGPKPNGKLWPTLVKFSTSRIEVWIEQTATGQVNYYDLAPVAPGQRLLTLQGLADKEGFEP